MKAYWINATAKVITEVEYTGLADLQRMVGGSIELAKTWPAGDTLYVDEEGLLKADPVWFRIAGREDQPFASSGVVVGREQHADTSDTFAPAITLAALQAEVQFLTPEQVKAWAKANSSEPFAAIYDVEGRETVLARIGEAFGVAPKPQGGS